VRNQLLVMVQDEHAIYVAGFRAWLKLGYCVRRGSTSHIRIWAKRAILRLARPWFSLRADAIAAAGFFDDGDSAGIRSVFAGSAGRQRCRRASDGTSSR